MRRFDHIADPVPNSLIVKPYFFAIQIAGSLSWSDHCQAHANRPCFSRPVSADKPVDLSFADAYGNPADSGERVMSVSQMIGCSVVGSLFCRSVVSLYPAPPPSCLWSVARNSDRRLPAIISGLSSSIMPACFHFPMRDCKEVESWLKCRLRRLGGS